MKPALSKLIQGTASIGALLAASMAPCCLPLLAAVGSASGVAALEIEPESGLMVMQGFALLAAAGAVVNFRKRGHAVPLAFSLLGTLALIAGGQGWISHWAIYPGLASLLTAAALNWLWRKKPQLDSHITCSRCGHSEKLRMPTDSCLYFWDCPACEQRVKPKDGDCCVFCSYGDVPCPPIQLAGACGC